MALGLPDDRDLFFQDRSSRCGLNLLTPGGIDVLDTAAFGLSGPSSVVPARGRLGLSTTDLVVTEKNANRVSVLHPR